MVGGEGDPPRVAHQQEPLEPDGPLRRVDVAPMLVLDRHDPAPGFHLDVAVEPLPVRDLVEVVAEGPVSRGRGYSRRRMRIGLAADGGLEPDRSLQG